MRLSFPRLMAQLEQRKYAPFYLLQGEETYYLDQLVDYMTEHVVSSPAKSLDMTIVYGQEHSLSEVLAWAKQYPMLNSHRLLVVREAQGLADLHKASGQALLSNYLDQPNLATLLVLVVKQKALPATTPWIKKAASQGVIFTGLPLKARELGPWISGYVGAKGYTITLGAKAQLERLVGPQLHLMANTLNKLLLPLSAGACVTEEMVTSQVSLMAQHNIFIFPGQVACRQEAKAVEMLHIFQRHPKQYPLLVILRLLTTFFTKLLILHSLPKPSSNPVASAALQVPVYFVSDYQKALPFYTAKQVTQAIALLHRADCQAKGIGYPPCPPGAILEELVSALFHT